MMKVYIYTLGCKVSQYESEAVLEQFEHEGFARCKDGEIADIYVINTCTVTSEADRKCRQVIRRCVAANPKALVLVCGCYAQRDAKSISEIEGVAYICGTQGKKDLVHVAKELLERRQDAVLVDVTDLESASYEELRIESSPRTRAYIKIEDGCECKCTYCAICDARGPVRSRDKDEILEEIQGLASRGTREVVLVGIETASYGLDLNGYRLIDLLEDVERLGVVDRIRLGSLMPTVMREGFVERLSHLEHIAPHFHLSLQSGSSSVLKRMHRRYNAEQAMRFLGAVRDAIPDVQFTTDIMVGFPGETDGEFDETMAFVRKARFLAAHVFCYSRRKGSEADLMEGQVPENLKHERSKRLMAEIARGRDEILDEVVASGKKLHLILETCENGVWTGHTDEFFECRVVAPEKVHGDLVCVVADAHKDGILKVHINS